VTACELCTPAIAPGHVIVVPRRHVADFFELTAGEQAAVLELLNTARRIVQEKHSPDGYKGDVPDPLAGVRRVLKS